MEAGSKIEMGGGGIDEEDMVVSWLVGPLLRSARGPVGIFWNPSRDLRSSWD